MNIQIIAVGKIKEKYFADAVAEYQKRLGRFCTLETVEIPDRKIPDKPSETEKEKVLRAEADDIMRALKHGRSVIALCVEGKQLTSEEFAGMLKTYALSGKSEISFVIGSSLGLDERVKARADFRLSMSKMTFPHQFARVMLLEQIYRAFKINAGEPYHK